MITRDWLDRILPPCAQLRDAAARITGDSGCGLSDGLLWMAQATEKDFFPRPAWKADGLSEDAWPVRFNGLQYKDRGQYLTNQGWPLSTTCWFVTLECGWRDQVCAEDPELAVVRAVFMMDVAIKWRDTSPKGRGDFLAAVEAAARADGISLDVAA